MVNNTATTISGLYDSPEDAQATVRNLINNGFMRDNISLVAGDAAGQYFKDEAKSLANYDVLNGAGTGAVIGSLSGLLVGLLALTVPGVGPILAAGPVTTALIGGGLGAVGGLIGALVDMGFDQEEAEYYAEGVRRGANLIMVRVSASMADRAVDILDRNDPINLEERVGQWRAEGWTGYDLPAEVDSYTG